jgi:glycosyltransferase involved in cell wall biosynthesis/predicted GH43/DUF377 family glycosyl hydrolase
MKLVWNGIVKNEAARIERCVKSLLPVIDCGIVVDTGSHDDTIAIITRLFDTAGKPVEIRQAPFENFSQARNVALQAARESKFDWDYLLLVDADMEFRVERPDWLNGHDGLSYDIRQDAGALSYWNRRLLSRQATGLYQGVTHEYLDVPSSGVIDGVYFLDHADGANRSDKFTRDIALLELALNTETNPGLIERYHFYLAQSYFESNNLPKAIEHYRKRAELGGYDEERWYARMRLACCYREIGEHAHFLWEMLRAYSERPQRSETLYELASFFRARGENFASLLFSVPGFELSVPAGDRLFVNKYVYQTGLKEEFSICAYYDERQRRTGRKESNKLALAGSSQAKFNMFWYMEPLAVNVPSFKPQRIDFTPPDSYVAMNPSIVEFGGTAIVLVRCVNYTITPEGEYRIRASDGTANRDNPIHTRNFIGPDDWREIALPKNWPSPKYDLVRAFEDTRLFLWRGELHSISTVRELSEDGLCQQVLAPIVFEGKEPRYGCDWKPLQWKVRRHEKNWVPWVYNDQLQFVYRLGTIIDDNGVVIFEETPKWDVSHISGGSQVVKVHVGGSTLWLALVHEAAQIPGRPTRYYRHRFVVFDMHRRLMRISEPFFFEDRQIEFAAGLAMVGGKLMVSYGVRDCEAWTATMDPFEVVNFAYRDAL